MHERLRAGPGVFGTAASPELSICATSHADTAIEKGSEAADRGEISLFEIELGVASSELLKHQHTLRV